MIKTINNYKLLLLTGLSLGICVSGFAQKADPEDDLLSKKEISVQEYTTRLAGQNRTLTDAKNQSEIMQDGSNNAANVSQRNTGTDPNLVNIMQSGYLNQAGVKQVGEGNTLELQQAGNNNSYEVDMIGNYNNSKVGQYGANNSIDHQMVGNNQNYELIQNGNNNRLMHSDFGTQSGPPQIIQNGNNMNLRIEQR